MRVLGIETSCDETAAAVYDGDGRLACARAVQPDGPARDLRRRGAGTGLPRPCSQAVAAVGENGRRRRGGHATIDGVAYTAGPGLIGALLVGAAVARSFAFAWDMPASGCITWKVICWRPCWRRSRRSSLSWRCWSPADIRCSPQVAGRPVPDPGQFAGRCGRRSLRQDRQAARPAVSRRTALAALAEQGRPDVFRFPRPLTERPGLDFSSAA